jgi:hypothetical protein
MSARLLTTAAAAALLFGAGSAFADCDAEIRQLEEAMLQSETGASAGTTDMPATQHQQEVLEEVDQEEEQAAVAEPPEDPASRHQEEVTGAAEDGASTGQAAELIAEAREMAAAGDQEGCMQRVEEAQALLDQG